MNRLLHSNTEKKRMTDLTMGELLVELGKLLPQNDRERLFVEWLVENKSRLPEACRELGIEPPEEGPGVTRLYQRLRRVVIPKLVEDRDGRNL